MQRLTPLWIWRSAVLACLLWIAYIQTFDAYERRSHWDWASFSKKSTEEPAPMPAQACAGIQCTAFDENLKAVNEMARQDQLKNPLPPPK